MHPDLALLLTLISLNYPYLELIFMVPKVFEPLKFYCSWRNTCLSLVILCIIETLSETHLLTSTFLDSILLGPAEYTGAEVLAESWVDTILSYGLLVASDGNLEKKR